MVFHKITKVEIKQQAIITEKVEAKYIPFLFSSVIYFRTCIPDLIHVENKFNNIQGNVQNEENKS